MVPHHRFCFAILWCYMFFVQGLEGSMFWAISLTRWSWMIACLQGKPQKDQIWGNLPIHDLLEIFYTKPYPGNHRNQHPTGDSTWSHWHFVRLQDIPQDNWEVGFIPSCIYDKLPIWLPYYLYVFHSPLWRDKESDSLTNGWWLQAHNEKANKEGIFSRISGFLNKGFFYYFMNHS